MTTGFLRVGLKDACAALSSTGLVRVISEIDDNGTIPARGLAGALPDLTPHQIRRATGQADGLELLDRTGDGIGLTSDGLHLADLYDSAARWARRHDFPDRNCDFASRIRHTFALLADHTTGAHTNGDVAHSGLDRLHQQLTELINTRPPQQRDTYSTAA